VATDPAGLSFLSYRRSCVDDARLLAMAQHDIGIPTWQDLTNLEEGHTDQQLRSVLAGDSIANAVAYLTPDVAASAVITKTELPCIVARIDRKDGFFLVPVAARGLDYADVAATAGSYLGTHDLGQWNVAKVVSNPLAHDDAAKIAQRVLKDRLTAIHRALPAGTPLRLELHSRSAPAPKAGTALMLDWTHRFAGRQATAETWRDILIPACETVISSCSRYAPGRTLTVSGFCALPAAVALGWTLLATRGIASNWEQVSSKREPQLWGLSAPRVASGYDIDLRSANPSADDVAVLLSIASNVEPAFGASRSGLPQFRAILHVRRDGPFPQDVATPGEASDIVALVVEGLRRARDQYQARGTVHLFPAAPVGLAFLIGQSLNTAGPIQTYEHVPVDAVGVYQPAARLMPAT